MRIERVMRWTPKDLTKWHRWYAWHPVYVGGSWVWLEHLERRSVVVPLDIEIWMTIDVAAWEYRL
jgi:hypothetical protein